MLPVLTGLTSGGGIQGHGSSQPKLAFGELPLRHILKPCGEEVGATLRL